MLKPIVLAVVVLSVTNMQSGAEPTFRGNAAHTGVYESATAPTLARVKWKFKAGGRIVSSPAVSGTTAYFGDSNSKLFAVDVTSGTRRWVFSAGGAINSSPAVAGGKVFFASVDGNFYAVDASSGAMVWKFKTAGEHRFTAPGIHGIRPKTEMMPDPFDTFLSSPAVVDGTVYFGSGDGNVYALDAASGQLKWKFTTGNVVHASPAVSAGLVYIGSWDTFFYAIEAATGNVRWKFQTGDDRETYNQTGIAGSAAVADDAVYFGCRDSHLYALNSKTGERKWAYDNHGGWVIASPAVKDGSIYFPTSDGTSFLGVNAANGRLLFSVKNKDISFSSPAIVADVAYYGTTDGWIHAVDIKAGKLIHEFQTDGSRENSSKYLDASGKPDNAKIFPEATLDGVFVGLSRVYSLGSVLSSPVIVDGVLYVGSTDGNLYALE